jgi:hypothetical protein
MQVNVNVPSKAPGRLVEVLGFGVFENGTENEVTQEQVDLYEVLSGQKFPEDGVLVVPAPTEEVLPVEEEDTGAPPDEEEEVTE